jgi:hypothetical protein
VPHGGQCCEQDQRSRRTDGGEPEHSAWRAFPQGSPPLGLSATALYGTRRDVKIARAGNRAAMGAGDGAHELFGAWAWPFVG